MWKCEKCGSNNYDNSIFCGNCGNGRNAGYSRRNQDVSLTTVPSTVPTTAPTMPKRYIASIDGCWEDLTIRHNGATMMDTHAYVFSQKLRKCIELTINLNVSMKSGAKSTDWYLMCRVGDKYEKVSKIHLLGGDGFASQTISFDRPLSFDAIVVLPTATGRYSCSYSLDLSVTDVWVEE